MSLNKRIFFFNLVFHFPTFKIIDISNTIHLYIRPLYLGIYKVLMQFTLSFTRKLKLYRNLYFEMSLPCSQYRFFKSFKIIQMHYGSGANLYYSGVWKSNNLSISNWQNRKHEAKL